MTTNRPERLLLSVIHTDVLKNVRTGDLPGIPVLAENIAHNGLKKPLRVWEKIETNGDLTTSSVHLTGGNRRITAIKLVLSAGWKDSEGKEISTERRADLENVKVTWVEGDEIDAAADQLADNIDPEDMSYGDVCASIKRLLDAGKSQAWIANKISKSTTYVSRAATVTAHAAPAVLEAMNAMPVDVVQRIATKKNTPEKQAEKVAAYKATIKELGGGSAGRAAAAKAAVGDGDKGDGDDKKDDKKDDGPTKKTAGEFKHKYEELAGAANKYKKMKMEVPRDLLLSLQWFEWIAGDRARAPYTVIEPEKIQAVIAAGANATKPGNKKGAKPVVSDTNTVRAAAAAGAATK